MTVHRLPGRSLVTRRALVDIIRPAVAGSYGVMALGRGGIGERVAAALGLAEPGIRISLRDGLAIDLHLTVAYGLPVAEVARQADSAVRYAIRRATAREVDRLTVHVGGMRYQQAAEAIPGSPGERAEGVRIDERPDASAALADADAEAPEGPAERPGIVEAAAGGDDSAT